MTNTSRVRLYSFSFKHHQPPADADFVVDTRRFMPTPADLDQVLTGLDGRDREVIDYVRTQYPVVEDVVTWLVNLVTDFVDKQIDCTIAVGCNHGIHRSVALVSLLRAVLPAYAVDDVDARHLRLEPWHLHPKPKDA
ncbi:RapZ C-terminal domain-containing protein [Lentzea californiensis]|uniref:RapZ C-terminal domain-containing protein n=1 Tax=Lentzea californiensis TaxID=438851 RepID=UPI002164E527|nr:RNase adapter RapZ [Lentzea californiensis]MCR3746656.1 P-loop ATPase protein family protein [Lentzea californiensis]